MNFSTWHPIYQRLAISTGAIAILLTTLHFAFTPYLSFLTGFLITLVSVLALKEYYSLCLKKQLTPLIREGITLGALYPLLLFFIPEASFFTPFTVSWIFFSLLTIFITLFDREEKPVQTSASTLFGLFFLSLPLSTTLQITYFFPIESGEDGRLWLLYLLTIVYLYDSVALFCGKAFGKRKLAPKISPNKTWEGAIGGTIIATAVSLLFSLMHIPQTLGIIESCFLGVALSVLAQIGDLAESLLKRDAEVKDSAAIPGLGGMLDMMDSLIFTAPFLYIYLSFKF